MHKNIISILTLTFIVGNTLPPTCDYIYDERGPRIVSEVQGEI